VKIIFRYLFSGMRKPIDGKLRNRLSVFLVCIAISTLMWMLIKVTREYEAPLRFTIHPIELPQGKVLVSNPDSLVTLVLNAKGLDLYSRLFFSGQNILNVSLAKIRLRHDGEDYSGYLRTSRMLKEIAAQLPAGVKLISVDPDTVHFVFRKTYYRKVPIKANVTFTFASQYQLYDSVHLKPDSVRIGGLKSIIDTIGFIQTNGRKFEKLSENSSAYLHLIKPAAYPPVILSADSVLVEVKVEKFTEADIVVPVKLFSEGRSLSYRIFPENVKLTCRVAMHDYKRLDPSLFEASINYDQATLSGSNRTLVEIKRKPAFVKLVKIDPPKVEFLILK